MPVPARVRIAGKTYIPGADRGVSVLLTAASWLLQRLPGLVAQHRRAELIRMLRYGRESIARLIQRYGRETRLPDLRHQLAADCPNRQAGIHERCDVYFPQLAPE